MGSEMCIRDSHCTQGGDKCRWTQLWAFLKQFWFQPGEEPVSRVGRTILIVQSQQHARLEWISNDGLWTRDHSYISPEGITVERFAGQRTSLLRQWRQLRVEFPELAFWDTHLLWGQPVGWQERVITKWVIQALAQQTAALDQGERWNPMAPDLPVTSQGLLCWDCLEPQWCETSLWEAFKNQIITAPIMPDHTGMAQTPDTNAFPTINTIPRRQKPAVK